MTGGTTGAELEEEAFVILFPTIVCPVPPCQVVPEGILQLLPPMQFVSVAAS